MNSIVTLWNVKLMHFICNILIVPLWNIKSLLFGELFIFYCRS
nr:MAG TPA: hypothetical protein [Bacteriophage sp.]